MCNPVVFDKEGIFIDVECNRIEKLDYFIAVPLRVEHNIHQNEYIEELNTLLMKYFDIDYELKSQFCTKF